MLSLFIQHNILLTDIIGKENFKGKYEREPENAFLDVSAIDLTESIELSV